MTEQELRDSLETKIMTDEELEKLIVERDHIKEKVSRFTDYYDREYRKLKNEEDKLSLLVDEENKRRLTASGKNVYKEKIKHFFETYEYVTKRVTDELWMVEVNGKKLRSSKGKYTWTSENRAFKGVCDYIYYNEHEISHAVDSNELDLGKIIEDLIKENYIKIIRVV